ncbi:hypothetical protein Slin14017_G111240 [Septoria linicola]|nr:hypothetical protein Slin14017_G111240 [Septoria linicola]
MENNDLSNTVVYCGEPALGRWKGKGRAVDTQEEAYTPQPESSSKSLQKDAGHRATRHSSSELDGSITVQSDFIPSPVESHLRHQSPAPLGHSADHHAHRYYASEWEPKIRYQSDPSEDVVMNATSIGLPDTRVRLDSDAEALQFVVNDVDPHASAASDRWAIIAQQAQMRMYLRPQYLDDDQATVSDLDEDEAEPEEAEMAGAESMPSVDGEVVMYHNRPLDAASLNDERGDLGMLYRVNRFFLREDESTMTLDVLTCWLRVRRLTVPVKKKPTKEVTKEERAYEHFVAVANMVRDHIMATTMDVMQE